MTDEPMADLRTTSWPARAACRRAAGGATAAVEGRPGGPSSFSRC